MKKTLISVIKKVKKYLDKKLSKEIKISIGEIIGWTMLLIIILSIISLIVKFTKPSYVFVDETGTHESIECHVKNDKLMCLSEIEVYEFWSN